LERRQKEGMYSKKASEGRGADNQRGKGEKNHVAGIKKRSKKGGNRKQKNK